MYEKTFLVPYYGLDPKRRMKIGFLLEFFQEAADLHSQEMKMSVDDLQRNDMTWVLRRYRINVFHYPGREELRVRTWHTPHRNLHSLRAFEVFDSRERRIASAWSSWVLFDRKRGRPTRLDRAAPQEYYDMAEPVELTECEDLPPMAGNPDLEKTFQVRWQELDVNGHTNHTVYCNWALETVPDDLPRTHLPTDIDAAFLWPVLREEVIVQTQKIADTPLQFAHAILLKESGKEAARLTSTWANAQPKTSRPALP